ncbi:hypothetical protein [Anaerosinus massiliensis]|uniref:hypothetical protein n=1 Tax=Massilibacillus massiliensis TaxID=1806837 RepID=UPI000DA5EF41|nr:hypothetical protein [Massilibacillus massiliensis]
MEISITYILDLMLKYGTLIVTIIIGVWARHKFNKQHDFNKDVEFLKSQLVQNQAILNSTINSFASERQASQERRIMGVDAIWKEVIDIRQKHSAVTFFYSILFPDEYNKELKNHPIVDLDEIEIVLRELSKNNLEVHRPFIGEKLWFLFWTYRAFQGRVTYRFIEASKKSNIQDWRDDKGSIEHLSNVLKKDELIYVKKYSPLGSLTIAINLIEYKILEEINLLISGEKAAENSYKNAIKFAEASIHDVK